MRFGGTVLREVFARLADVTQHGARVAEGLALFNEVVLRHSFAEKLAVLTVSAGVLVRETVVFFEVR